MRSLSPTPRVRLGPPKDWTSTGKGLRANSLGRERAEIG